MKEAAGLGFGHEKHPPPGRRVRDLASGTEGELMAVVREEVATHTGRCRPRRACIRPESRRPGTADRGGPSNEPWPGS